MFMIENPEAKGPLGLRVFSATRARDRQVLGETITNWIKAHPENKLCAKIVLQSSDAEFHCLTIVLFFHYPAPVG